MKKRTFACEVLTPLFLGGADVKSPEFRAPSIRGVMRYWYRALLGGTTASSQDLLHKNESALFGSVENGGALATQLRALGASQPVSYQKSPPVYDNAGKPHPTGKDYLFWSVALAGRPYIAPGEKFDFILKSTLDSSAIMHGEMAFWLLCNLGAVGARANRGAGSFQAVSDDAVLSFTPPGTINDLKEQLERGIAFCWENLGKSWMQFGSNPPDFDVIHPDYCRISIVADQVNGWETYNDALNAIGGHFVNYRTHTNPLGKSDHDAVLDWVKQNGKIKPILKRPVFGLPLAVRYKSGLQDEIRSGESDRRGSPLHIHITRLKTGCYVGVLTLFKSRFLPSGVNLKLKNRNWETPPPPDYSVIEGFMDAFPVKPRVTL